MLKRQTISAMLLSRPHVCYESYLTFTQMPWNGQSGQTVLMVAAYWSVSNETLQLLFDSGAAASINDKDDVSHLHYSPPFPLFWSVCV
jgi:hypothetical protein